MRAPLTDLSPNHAPEELPEQHPAHEQPGDAESLGDDAGQRRIDRGRDLGQRVREVAQINGGEGHAVADFAEDGEQREGEDATEDGERVFDLLANGGRGVVVRVHFFSFVFPGGIARNCSLVRRGFR